MGGRRPVGEGQARIQVVQRLVDVVERCRQTGLLPVCPEAREGVTQIWAVTHGAVSLALAGLGPEDETATLVGRMALGLAGRLGAQTLSR